MKKKLLFVFRHEYEDKWQDGLYKAILLLSNDYQITMSNLIHGYPSPFDYDFVLGWGAFGSEVDRYLQTLSNPKGLCIAGVAHPPTGCEKYDVLFYETEWYRPVIEHHPNKVHAFGINTDIYKPKRMSKVWDYTTVGAFALWKRQRMLISKPGMKLAIGEVQKGNSRESLGIISELVSNGVFVSDMVEPKVLCNLINMSKRVYIPADIFGGGERAILESRACGIDVEVEYDNPKLKELLVSPVYDHKYYYEKLKEGISHRI